MAGRWKAAWNDLMKTRITIGSTPVPKQWVWHYQQLQTLRDRLLDSSREHMAEGATAVEPHSRDMADSATDEFDHVLALGLLSHEQDALHEVDSAMHRIREGTYGVCEDTGMAIPAARLRAMPWTRRTKEAEERAERQGIDQGAHLGAVGSFQRMAASEMASAEDSEPDELYSREVARHKQDDAVRAVLEGKDGD